MILFREFCSWDCGEVKERRRGQEAAELLGGAEAFVRVTSWAPGGPLRDEGLAYARGHLFFPGTAGDLS